MVSLTAASDSLWCLLPDRVKPRLPPSAGRLAEVAILLVAAFFIAATLALVLRSPGPVFPTPTQAPAPAVAARGTFKPGPDNTGVPAGTRLAVVNGGMVITTDDAVVNAKDIRGPVVIDANRVTIQNSKVHGTSQDYGVLVRSGSVHIRDSEIWGFRNGIAFDNWAATRVNLHGMSEDGVKLGSNVTLVDSWIHGMTPEAGAHADGGQMQGGSANVMVSHNNIDMAHGSVMGNSALFLAPDLGPSSDGPVTVKNNWLNGGNFTLFCVDGDNGQYFVQNISILSNRFGPDMNYGQVRVNVPVTARGNVVDRTDLPLDHLMKQ